MLMFVLILALICLAIIFIIPNTRQRFLDEVNGIIENANEENNVKLVGEDVYVSSADITSIEDGTPNFDANDEPGNDSSASNKIVRSFDKIKYNVELTMALKPGQTSTETGGKINVEASLPDSLANLVKWDVDSMTWLEGSGVVSEDGTKLTGTYKMSDNVTATSGKQNLEIVLQVWGAGNETEIIPTFTFSLEGNEDTEKLETTADTVKVSSTGKYNVQLHSNTMYLSNKTTVDYGEGETLGRMYGYGFTVQLYNESEEKGLKGLEYPKGEISFDIDLKLERTKENSTEREDITNECTPVLWNYRLNDWNTQDRSGLIDGRDMFWSGNQNQLKDPDLPLGIYIDSDYSTYDSGDLKINQDGSKLKVTIDNYGFNGVFPYYNCAWETAVTEVNRNKIYTDNIGTFSVGYMQIFVPYNDASTMQDRKYYLSVNDNNMNITTNSDEIVTIQMKDSDDSDTTEHLINKNIDYGQSVYVYDKNIKEGIISTRDNSGDGRLELGNYFFLDTRFRMNISNDDNIYSANRFIKFDGEGYEPMYLDNGQKYIWNYSDTEFDLWYVTKKDGTNWTSQDEMNNANIEDMDIYNNIDDIPENKICIGVYVELKNGYIAAISGGNNSLYLPLKIRKTAIPGKTYGITVRTKMWIDDLDKSVYTITNPNVEWPKPIYDSGNYNYIKTEYDEKGNKIQGTHNTSTFGNTVQAVGANLHGDIRAINSSGDDKESYDLGKNENIITYSVEPKLDKNDYIDEQISNVTLKAEVTIPNGLTYVSGSSKQGEESYSEPEITKNSDGSTTLVWYIYNCTSGEDIVPITFEASINNKTENETKYEAKFVISEEIGEDGAKIGNCFINFRTSTNTVTVVNLGSHRVYQETTTPIIENNGEITYKVIYQNNSEIATPDLQVLDILPFNGDGRGTSYNGTYTLKDIKVTQNVNNEIVSNDNLSLYTTTNLDAREISPKDESIGVSEIWNKKEIGKEINESATVIALKGEVQAGATVEIEITLKTANNSGGDSYYNVATAQVTKDAEVMTSAAIQSQVVARKINGMIWYDTNENGTKEDSESYAQGIEVELLNSDGTKAKDTSGNEIANQLTTANGEYEFINLTRNDYIVRIVTDNKYKLTTANIGTNKEINSKFEESNGNKESYVITTLNGLQSPEIIEANVNAGLVVKDAKVIIHYLEEDNTPEDDRDNNKLLEDKEITGHEVNGEMKNYKLGDSYSVNPENIENYITLRNSNNTSGVFESEVVEVTYYYTYNKQDITVKKVWNDNNDEARKRPASIKVELKNGNNVVQEVVLSNSNANSDDSNIWETILSNLDIYDTTGQKINYTVDEKENEGTLENYNKTIEGYTITNTFTQNTEKININVTKVWDDNNNYAGKRPNELTLILKKQVGESYQEVTRTTINGTDNKGSNDNEWQYTFSGISKYDEYNNEIKYVVEEETPEFYTGKVEKVENNDGNTDNLEFKVTNTFSVPDEKISVPVTKVWDDNGNRAGKRPTSVTLVLTGKNKEGAQVGELNKITLTPANAIEGQENVWQGEITDLPRYDDKADEINYELSEENLGSVFYTKENTSINQGTKTITNKFVVPNDTIEIEVSKKWEDNNNEQNARPENVTLYLRGNSQEYSIVLTSSNETEEDTNVWKGKITGLPKYNVNGDEIKYVLDEKPVDSVFYAKTNVDQETKTVTNKFSIPEESVQIPVTKVWEDNNNLAGKRPQTIELQIINKRTQEVVGTQIMQGNSTTDDGWSYTFEVPKYAGSTEEAEYEIGEKDLGNKFYKTNVDQATITNTFVVPDEKVSVNVSKQWVDTDAQKDKRPTSIIVKLLANGEEVETNRTIELNAGNEWKGTFENLAKYDSLGNEINYTVDEVSSGSNFYQKDSVTGDMANGYVITNKFVRPTDITEVTVNKVWEDNNNEAGKRPSSVTLKVAGNGKTFEQEVTGTESNTWTYTFTGLPKYDDNGDVIEYTVDEENLTQNAEFYQKKVDQESKTITNTFNVPGENVTVRAAKVWNDENNKAGKRPESVTIQVKNGESVVATEEANEGNNWQVEFTVPKYDRLGNVINYTVDEASSGSEFYQKEGITGDMTEGFTITNKFVVPDIKVSVNVTKSWVDTPEQQDKRPTSVTAVLMNGEEEVTKQELNESNNWETTFDELPMYDSLGNVIDYTVKEEVNENDLYFYNSSVSGSIESGFTITNTFTKPIDTTEVTVKKYWDDNGNANGRRPESVTLTLAGTGEGVNVTKEQEITVANAENGDTNTWGYTFTDLPKYDDNGNEVVYRIDEKALNENAQFYLKEVDQETKIITNTFKVPGENVEIPVTKVWNDNNDEAKKRPTSVTLQIKNGEEIVASETVTGTEGWAHTFSVPKYNAQGQEITYTADEQDLGNMFYTKENSSVTGDMTSGFTVTNKFEVPDSKININVSKEWNDTAEQKDKRPASVTVQLLANGEEVSGKTLELNNDNQWKGTFTDLAKYDSLGNAINYAVEEKDTRNIFYTAKNAEVTGNMESGYVITNKFVRPTETISIIANKVWNDNAEQASRRPESVTLVVKNDQTGEEVESKVVNSSNLVAGTTNTWSVEFTGLQKYDENGNEIKYTLEERETKEGDLHFYRTEANNVAVEDNQATIRNNFVTPGDTTQVTVTKVWNDNEDANGRRPNSIMLKVSGNGQEYKQEVNAESNWSHTFTNLPKYDSNGKEIVYTASEAEVNNGDLKFYTNDGVTGDVSNEYKVTNTFSVPDEKVEITVNKVWEDNDIQAQRRPGVVVINVKGEDGTVVDSYELNTASETSHTFTNLPKYNSKGQEINYTVEEAEKNSGDLHFYTSEVGTVTDVEENKEQVTITNTFIVPDDKADVTVTKVWSDNSNEAGKRPASIKLLLKDGTETVREEEVRGEKDTWQHTFTDLTKYDENGQEKV